jgi:hypothetical protein
VHRGRAEVANVAGVEVVVRLWEWERGGVGRRHAALGAGSPR